MAGRLERVVDEVNQRFMPLVEVPLAWFRGLRTSVQDRLVGLALFAPSATVLGIAATLTADPSGMGTHRQLGLGGCAVLTATGLPCPMCGMTTTFTHMAHFDVAAAFMNQPFGPVLFLCTVVAAVIGGMDLLVPRQRWRSALGFVERYETPIAVGLLVGMFAGWSYKVALVKGLLPWV